MNPDFWNDPERAESILRDLKLHKSWIGRYQDLGNTIGDLEVLYEFFQEGEGTEEEIGRQYKKSLKVLDDVEFRSTLNKPEDELSAILEINAGAGGN